MLKNELKVALAILGTAFVPLFAQADQSMDAPRYGSSGNQQQQPTLAPGDIVQDGQLSPGYVANAGIATYDGWDIAVGGTYLYWKPSLDYDVVAALVDQTAGVTNGLNGNTEYLFQDPGYTSGFKVDLGFGLAALDNWQAFFEYTWFKNTNNVSATGNASKALVLDNFKDSTNIMPFTVGSLSSEAKVGYQTLDFRFQRAGYFGKNFVANLGAGLRAQWISFTNTNDVNVTALNGVYTGDVLALSYLEKQSSWQLGTNFAFDGIWQLGWGFSLLTNAHASVLYTSYNSNSTFSGTADAIPVSGSLTGLHNYGAVRPILETFIGLAWAMYFCDQSFHIDLAVGYDFNVYFNQYIDLMKGPQNFYLQGLDVKLGFDF